MLRRYPYDHGHDYGNGTDRRGSGFEDGGDTAEPGTYRPLVGETIAGTSRHYISKDEDPEQHGYSNDDKNLRTMESRELKVLIAAVKQEVGSSQFQWLQKLR